MLFFYYYLIDVKLCKEAASPGADFLGLQHREISDLTERRQTGLQPKQREIDRESDTGR